MQKSILSIQPTDVRWLTQAFPKDGYNDRSYAIRIKRVPDTFLRPSVQIVASPLTLFYENPKNSTGTKDAFRL